MKTFEILTTKGALILVNSTKTIGEVTKLLKTKHGIDSYSYKELDTEEIEDTDISFTF